MVSHSIKRHRTSGFSNTRTTSPLPPDLQAVFGVAFLTPPPPLIHVELFPLPLPFLVSVFLLFCSRPIYSTYDRYPERRRERGWKAGSTYTLHFLHLLCTCNDFTRKTNPHTPTAQRREEQSRDGADMEGVSGRERERERKAKRKREKKRKVLEWRKNTSRPYINETNPHPPESPWVCTPTLLFVSKVSSLCSFVVLCRCF